MREVGTIEDAERARTFADYLLTQDITSRLVQRHDGWAVWVHREELVERAKEEIARFRDNPDDPRYRGVSDAARLRRKAAERDEKKHVKNTINLSGQLGYRRASRCPLSFALIGISIAVGIWSNLGSNMGKLLPLFLSSSRVVTVPQAAINDDGEPYIDMAVQFENEGLEGVRHGQLWRLITPIFIHFGAIHLIFNMMWVYELGGLIEMRRGSWRLAALVLVSAIASNLAQYLWSLSQVGPGSVAFSGGMSGVVYALFGFAWMKGHFDPDAGITVSQSTVTLMIAWLFLCMTGMMGPIGNAAHVVGLLVGMLMGYTSYFLHEIRR